MHYPIFIIFLKITAVSIALGITANVAVVASSTIATSSIHSTITFYQPVQWDVDKSGVNECALDLLDLFYTGTQSNGLEFGNFHRTHHIMQGSASSVTNHGEELINNESASETGYFGVRLSSSGKPHYDSTEMSISNLGDTPQSTINDAWHEVETGTGVAVGSKTIQPARLCLSVATLALGVAGLRRLRATRYKHPDN